MGGEREWGNNPGLKSTPSSGEWKYTGKFDPFTDFIKGLYIDPEFKEFLKGLQVQNLQT